MNKYILALALILMFTVSLVSCSSGQNDDTFSEPSEKTNETGFPADQVQVTLLYVDGKTYMKSNNRPDMIAHPFEEFALYGKVEKNDIRNIPKEELHASHLDKGCLVYTSDDHEGFIWVVDTSRGVYTLHQFGMIDDPEWWQPEPTSYAAEWNTVFRAFIMKALFVKF